MVVFEENPDSKKLRKVEDESDNGIVHEFQTDESQAFSLEIDESSDDSGSSDENVDNAEENPEISDDSSSEDDEESLIEIPIPGSDHSSGRIQEPEENLQFNLPIFLPESMLKQQDIVEQLLAEMNEVNIEEENLIEIDISKGSIKCPRFEIEA
ncbi:hypothetical protein DITRI_Ditri01bG0196000 [Diplodiscus trichospermus]